MRSPCPSSVRAEVRAATAARAPDTPATSRAHGRNLVVPRAAGPLPHDVLRGVGSRRLFLRGKEVGAALASVEVVTAPRISSSDRLFLAAFWRAAFTAGGHRSGTAPAAPTTRASTYSCPSAEPHVLAAAPLVA